MTIHRWRRPATSLVVVHGALIILVLTQLWIGSTSVLDNLNNEQFALVKQNFLSNITRVVQSFPQNPRRVRALPLGGPIPFQSLMLNSSNSFDHSTGTLWSLELALRRATTEPNPLLRPIKLEKSSRVAVFLQFGTNIHLLPDLIACTANIVAAANMVAASAEPLKYLDIYLGFIEGHDHRALEIQREFERFSNVKVFVSIVQNAGADVGQFLAQFTQTNQTYDMVIKLHTKTDPIWRERMVESLCASPEQVVSAWRLLDRAQTADQRMILAPLGTMFSRHFNLSDIFPHIARKYQYHNRTDTEPVGQLPRGVPIWGFYTVNYMNRIYRKLGGTANRILGGKRRLYRDREHWIVAGTSFWANWRALYPQDWKDGRVYEDYVEERLTPGYKDNYGMEHAVERLFPSILRQREGVLCELQPAPRVFLLFHFMQSINVRWDDRMETFVRETIKTSISAGIQGMVYPWTPYSKPILTGLLSEKESRLPFFLAVPLQKHSTIFADLIQEIEPLMRMSHYVRLNQQPVLMIVVEHSILKDANNDDWQSKMRQLSMHAKSRGFEGLHTIFYPDPVSVEKNSSIEVKDLATKLGMDASLSMANSQNTKQDKQVKGLKYKNDDDESSDDMSGRPGDQAMLQRLADTRIQYRGNHFAEFNKSLTVKASERPSLIRRVLTTEFFQLAGESSRDVQASFHFVDPSLDWQEPLLEFQQALPNALLSIQKSLTDLTCRDVVHNTF